MFFSLPVFFETVFIFVLSVCSLAWALCVTAVGVVGWLVVVRPGQEELECCWVDPTGAVGLWSTEGWHQADDRTMWCPVWLVTSSPVGVVCFADICRRLESSQHMTVAQVSSRQQSLVSTTHCCPASAPTVHSAMVGGHVLSGRSASSDTADEPSVCYVCQHDWAGAWQGKGG